MAKNKLTKAKIIENIYENVDVNKRKIHNIVDLLFEEIKNGLIDDRIVELRGFGTFEIRLRKGREDAKNPKTGERIIVKNHGVTAFRPGQELKKIAWPKRE